MIWGLRWDCILRFGDLISYNISTVLGRIRGLHTMLGLLGLDLTVGCLLQLIFSFLDFWVC